MRRKAKREEELSSYFPGEQGCLAQSVGHLSQEREVLGSTPGLVTFFRFSR